MKRWITLWFITLFSLFGAEVLTLKTSDGYELKAWFTLPAKAKPPYPLALFAHEYGSDHIMWKEISKKLRERGYATLELDLRGHGASTKKGDRVIKVKPFHFSEDAKRIDFAKIPNDLSAWMEKMDARDDIDIEEPLIFGSSLGGGAVIALMSDYEPKAVVTLSPASPKNFDKKSVIESVEQSASPWLIITSKGDFARQSAMNYAQKAQLATLIIVPGKGHGSYTLSSSLGYIWAFLDRYLK